MVSFLDKIERKSKNLLRKSTKENQDSTPDVHLSDVYRNGNTLVFEFKDRFEVEGIIIQSEKVQFRLEYFLVDNTVEVNLSQTTNFKNYTDTKFNIYFLSGGVSYRPYWGTANRLASRDRHFYLNNESIETYIYFSKKYMQAMLQVGTLKVEDDSTKVEYSIESLSNDQIILSWQGNVEENSVVSLKRYDQLTLLPTEHKSFKLIASVVGVTIPEFFKHELVIVSFDENDSPVESEVLANVAVVNNKIYRYQFQETKKLEINSENILLFDEDMQVKRVFLEYKERPVKTFLNQGYAGTFNIGSLKEKSIIYKMIDWFVLTESKVVQYQQKISDIKVKPEPDVEFILVEKNLYLINTSEILKKVVATFDRKTTSLDFDKINQNKYQLIVENDQDLSNAKSFTFTVGATEYTRRINEVSMRVNVI